MTTDIQSYNFISKLKELPFVEQVILFGSRARGDHRERSDIDIAVKLRHGNSRDEWLKVMDIIDDADTLLEIDCLNYDEANEKFKSHILSDGKVIYERHG